MAIEGQPSFCNYVKTQKMLDSQGISCQTSVQYYDPLGRPSLHATNATSPLANYVYTLDSYNEAGQKRRSYSPIAAGQSIDYFQEGEIADLCFDYYNEDEDTYIRYWYDYMGRPITQIGPGGDWHFEGRGIEKSYGTNTSNSVKHYLADGASGALLECGYYAAGELHQEATTDEDGRTLQVFTDRMGLKVLERRNGDNDTYFVYNSIGKLRFVLLPDYQKHPHKALNAYEYRYNSRGLVDKKILPSCEYIQYWYDQHDRLISMQDALLREHGRYRFYLYDSLGRQVIMGTCSNFNYNHQCVVSKSSGDGWQGTGYDYPFSYGVTHPRIESITCYDDYGFLSKSLFSSHTGALSANNTASARGLVTGTYSRTSQGGSKLAALYYDDKGRVVQKKEAYPNGASVSYTTTYSFTDKPETETCQMQSGASSWTVSKYTAYNEHNDLPSSVALSYNNGSAVQVASYEYDDLGRLINMERGGSAGSVSYDYNIRSWTTAIDSPSFKEWLHYTDGPGQHCFSGNVSTLQWQVSGEDFRRGYKFYYDGLGRMTRADYGEGESFTTHTGRYSERILEYTLNGDIRKLERHGRKTDGNWGKIDNLRMYYTGCLLDSVKEDAMPMTHAGAFDFVSRTVSADAVQYAYHGDGSLKWDANKGVTRIDYDRQGFPQKVSFHNGNVTSYDYTADGERLCVKYQTAVPNITIPLGKGYTPTVSTLLSADSIKYYGNFIFENGQPSMYLFDGGYITFANDQPSYHYYTKDHLGNNRTVVSHDGSVEQVTHYYPFGAIYCAAGSNDALQHYKYNGKELDRMHGLNLYDYGYRQYDPLLARWTQMDRKCEDYYQASPFVYCLNSPVSNIDPDGRSVWTKLGRMAYKVGRQVTKNGLSALNQIDTYTSAFSDITDNVNTLTDENASTAERVMAGISLASEALPVSVGDAKDAGKAIIILPNNGISKPHGGLKHNATIDNYIRELKNNPKVFEIRKNQRQVDKNGKTIGLNRPDVQYNKDGTHHNIEFDTKKGSMEKHRKVITNNDPNSVNEFYIIEK